MTVSMTGFGSSSANIEQVAIVVDLKSVNHRYLDIQFKIPEELRSREIIFKQIITARAKRGKIECRISINKNANHIGSEVSYPALHSLRAMEEKILDLDPTIRKLSMNEILRWPSILQEETIKPEALHNICDEAVEQAAKKLQTAKIDEGRKLKQIVLEKTKNVADLVDKVTPEASNNVAIFEEKLKNKIDKLDIEINEERIAQEIVIFSSKIDIEEEIQRLKVHVSSIGQILESNETQGKRLDFLMQELNREANTLGSKAASIETTNTAMELKVIIEQIREQVQNIECRHAKCFYHISTLWSWKIFANRRAT